MPYKPRHCKTLHNPQPTQLLQQAHMMSHITCQLRFLCWVHASFTKLSSLPSSLFSPLSSCLVQVACDVILPAVLFPNWSVLSIIQLPCTRCMLYHPASWFVPLYSVQHCAPINVFSSLSLPRLWLLPVRQEGEFIFKWTFTLKCTFYNKRNWIITTLHAANVFNICCVMCQCFEEEEKKNDNLNKQQIIFVMFLRKKWINKKCCSPLNKDWNAF